jgi:hypothetical protein
MATTNTLFTLTPQNSTAPATIYATLDTITGTTDVPVPVMPVLDFQGVTADEFMDWYVTVPSWYTDLGFRFSYKFAMTGTDAQAVEMEFYCRKYVTNSSVISGDIDITGATPVSIATASPQVADEFTQSATGDLSHANAGSPSVGDRLIIRVARDESHEDNADDLQLLEVLVLEI